MSTSTQTHKKKGPLELTGQSAARSEERAALLLVQRISFSITGSTAVLSGKRRRIKKSGGGEEKTVKKRSRVCALRHLGTKPLCRNCIRWTAVILSIWQFSGVKLSFDDQRKSQLLCEGS